MYFFTNMLKTQQDAIAADAMLFPAIHDGGDGVWNSTFDNQIYIYHFYGDDEGEITEIDLSGVFTIDTSIRKIYHLLKVGDKIAAFPTDGANNHVCGEFALIDIVPSGSPSPLRNITLVTIPYEISCFPAYDGTNIWFVTSFDPSTDSEQYIFSYDPTTFGGSPLDGWSGLTSLYGTPQTAPRWLCYGGNGYVYVQSLNENGVIKIDVSTALYVTLIIINRFQDLPSYIDSHAFDLTNDGRLVVAGFNGMISSIDLSTDVSTNIAGVGDVLGTISNIFDDGTYIWAFERYNTANPVLARVTKGGSPYTDNIRVMEKRGVQGTERDYTDVYFEAPFTVINANTSDRIVTEILYVKETGGNSLVEGVDYTLGYSPQHGVTVITILSGAPNVVGPAPLEISAKMDSFIHQTSYKDYNIVELGAIARGEIPNFMIKLPEIIYGGSPCVGSPCPLTTPYTMCVGFMDLSLNNIHHTVYFIDGNNLTDSWDVEEDRYYEITVKGTAMIATGPNLYHGEAE